MIPIPLGSRVWIATGHTDMRRGAQGLALQVQEGLKRDPHSVPVSTSGQTLLANQPAVRLTPAIPFRKRFFQAHAHKDAVSLLVVLRLDTAQRFSEGNSARQAPSHTIC